MHTRADPYGSDPKLVRIGLSCTLAPTYRRQFGSAYPYQRGTDKKNGAVWLRSIWLPCEPTDRTQKEVQIGNEANFVYNRGLSTFLYFSSWLRGISTSNMYLSLIESTWIRSRVHANDFGFDPVCTPENFWIRSKNERSRTDLLSCAQGLNFLLCKSWSLSDQITVAYLACSRALLGRATR